MLKNKKYREVIKEMMTGLTNETKITVLCENCDETAGEMRIKTVNGHSGCRTFREELQALGLNLERSAMRFNQRLNPPDRPVFLNELIRSVSSFSGEVVQSECMSGQQGSLKSGDGKVWKFISPEIRFTDNTEMTPEDLENILEKIIPFSQCWHQSISQTKTRLCVLEIIAEYIPCEPVYKLTPAKEKVMLNTTVEHLAVLLKIFFNVDFFDIPHKSELYRFISETFCTPGTPNISPNSLKNHFNMPTPETLAYWDDELTLMRQWVKDYYRRFHSN